MSRCHHVPRRSNSADSGNRDRSRYTRHITVIKMGPPLGPRSAVTFFGIGIDTNRNLAQIPMKKSLVGEGGGVTAYPLVLVTHHF